MILVNTAGADEAKSMESVSLLSFCLSHILCDNKVKTRLICGFGGAVPMGKPAKPLIFEGFKKGCNMLQGRFAWQGLRFVTFRRVSKTCRKSLSDRHNIFP